jgi:hypothetical protein
MSDLKSFLWNNKTATSIKKRNTNKQFTLREWPDFGHVGCPGEYITMSAYLVRHALTFKQLKLLCQSNSDEINHFLYVCQMLQILEVSEVSDQANKGFKTMTSRLGQKLKGLFFERQAA